MRFAPPKSAPPDARKCSKDHILTSPGSTKLDDGSLSGWSSVPVPEDWSLLKECAAASLRRCSSATQRHSHGQLVVSFSRKQIHKLSLSRSDSNLSKGNTKCMVSKDSGVDDDTLSMDRLRLYDDDEEFSDISSDDEGIENEPELMRLTVSDSEMECTQDTIHNSMSLIDMSSDRATDDRRSPNEESELRNYINRVQNTSSSISGICHDSGVKLKPKKHAVKREHQLPKPITPDIPDSPAPTKTQLWSRARKFERLSTSPSLCTYNESCSLLGPSNNKRDNHNLINDALDNMIHANRPSYRNEKRRTSNMFKSSCSIPSFSTPCQALLLVGVQPGNKPTDTNRNKFKPAPRTYKPTLAKERPRNNIIELPALSVNGAGDLVIRKKQIISG